MVIVNGLASEDNKIVMDEGYLFGRGVFETILLKDNPLFLKEHLSRLNQGMRQLGFENSVEESELLQVLKSHRIKNCVLKLVATEKNIILTTRQNPYESFDDTEGFKLKLSKLKRNPFSYITYLKTLSYMDNLLEREAAGKQGFHEVLFLNMREELAEGSATNVFFIKNQKILTPSVECGLLNGIIRQWVLKNYEVTEGRYSLEKLLDCEGAFVTNSLMGIMPVACLEDYSMRRSTIVSDIRYEYDSYLKNRVDNV
jgi:4-amino-4-deoxychorismate lyase